MQEMAYPMIVILWEVIFIPICRRDSKLSRLQEADQAPARSRLEPDSNGLEALQASVYHRERSRLQVSYGRMS